SDATTLTPLQYGVELADEDEFEESEEYDTGENTDLVVENLLYDHTYYWRVFAEDSFGLRGYSEVRSFHIGESNGFSKTLNTQIPHRWNIISPYPNPFNASIRFSVAVPTSEAFHLTVYNILGRKVKTIFSGHSQVGYQLFSWQPNEPSGIYFLSLTTSSGERIREKILYLQ
ncbi:MAG: T9SS type A sorting domain-containing protein, partial [Candidatus Electryonea clarkiae]|nr:T9SS type A sorting domain-containing protein [Candidatus Electryonea clarkiae]